mmetsp:Transcript_31004/g.87053  ORF Transcript_31004/g.87053 Transcript_31004/m.87053 type:complete len:455 (+) Transcript_31004:65-1429(+)
MKWVTAVLAVAVGVAAQWQPVGAVGALRVGGGRLQAAMGVQSETSPPAGAAGWGKMYAAAVQAVFEDKPMVYAGFNQSLVAGPLHNLENQVLHFLTRSHEQELLNAAGPVGGAKEVDELVVKHLAPQIQEASNASQQELNDLQGAFSKCGGPGAHGGPGDLGVLDRARGVKVKDHAVCRQGEADVAKVQEQCETTLQSLKFAMTTSCDAIKMVARDPSQGAAHCAATPGMARGDWLKSNRDWFIKEFDEHQKLTQHCESATNASKAQEPLCAGKATALSNKREECNAKQANLEDAFCAYKTGWQHGCESYTSCYTTALAKYEERRPIIQRDEESRKVQYGVLKRISCLTDVATKGGSEAEIDACRKITNDTKHLDLKYFDTPSQEACAAVGPTPCGDDFLGEVYGGLPKNTLPKECMPCPGDLQHQLGQAPHRQVLELQPAPAPIQNGSHVHRR